MRAEEFTMADSAIDVEIDRNYDAFRLKLDSYLSNHAGQIALMRSGAVFGFFDRLGEALDVARREFPDGLYSIQPVEKEPVDLGFFSHIPGFVSRVEV